MRHDCSHNSFMRASVRVAIGSMKYLPMIGASG